MVVYVAPSLRLFVVCGVSQWVSHTIGGYWRFLETEEVLKKKEDTPPTTDTTSPPFLDPSPDQDPNTGPKRPINPNP
eukprot:scaffold37679_cov76-Cyclotella_meneghiniana.AAC.1